MHREIPREISVESDLNTVVEAPRSTPVRGHFDVLVCGGGPAGVGAALAAAGEGASVLVIERFGMLGGMWTAGLVNPFFEAERNGWLVSELIERLKARGAWAQWKFAYTFDPEALKHELERMMAHSGVQLLYHTLCVDSIVTDGRVRGAIVESKAGREAVLADVVIDCTGDGDIAARAGASFEFGREEDGAVQPMTLMFEIDGIGSFDHASAPELHDLMNEAISRSGLTYAMPTGRVGYAPWLIALPALGTAALQHTHVYRLNPLSPADLTAGTIDARRQVFEAVEILRNIPGLESARLVRTASHIGVRESRRIAGVYCLTLGDLRRGAVFDDGIARCAFGVDIHDIARGEEEANQSGAVPAYEIPYRCLVPQDVDGLLVAGRCISGSHEAHASYRVTGTCMAMGQAAGLAAAWSAADGSIPRDLDGGALRRGLIERGVRLGDTD